MTAVTTANETTARADSRIPFLIVGGGLAGGRAAQALREEGAIGRIVLLGDEELRPYNRPGLSKDFLRSESNRDDLFVHPPEWAAQHEVELRTGAKAERLDVQGRTVTLAGGESLAFERLLLATGSAPRRLPIPGAALENVLLLRDVGDAEEIQRLAAGTTGAQRAVMVGGGFIGAEVAASLRQMGLETTVVARETVLWEHLFGAELSGVFQRKLTEKGVEVLNGETVARIEGHGRVERVVTVSGRTIECDFVVMGVGAAPRLTLAEGTPLAVDGGIVTDQHLRTSIPVIYAAGDIASFWSRLYGKHLRVEHWDVAEKHGFVAGRNMAREAAGAGAALESYDEPPYFFSDLFDLSMEYLGHNAGYDETVVRGDPAGNELTGFYLRGGRLVAALFVNRNGDVDPTRRLIQERLTVDDTVRSRLADPTADLAALAALAV
jgi:3-phenylpropionate/trans-cinnamate dioxygenase ferredoxin reductase subunit